jgi:hypothetical protein
MNVKIEDIFDFINDDIIYPYYTMHTWHISLIAAAENMEFDNYQIYKNTNCYKLIDNIINKREHILTKKKFLIFYAAIFYQKTKYNNENNKKLYEILQSPILKNNLDAQYLLACYHYKNKQDLYTINELDVCIDNNHPLALDKICEKYIPYHPKFSRNEIYAKLSLNLDNPYCVYNLAKYHIMNLKNMEEQRDNCKKYNMIDLMDNLDYKIYIFKYMENKRIMEEYIKREKKIFDDPKMITYNHFIKQDVLIKNMLGYYINSLPLNDERLKIIEYMRNNNLMYEWGYQEINFINNHKHIGKCYFSKKFFYKNMNHTYISEKQLINNNITLDDTIQLLMDEL